MPTRALVVIAVLLACGCGPSDVMDEATGYTDARDQQRFKEALTEARVPFEARTANGSETVWYPNRFKLKVVEVQERLFGSPPPNGRNVTQDLMRRLEPELQKMRIPYRKATYHGTEYIAWDAAEDDKVDAVLGTYSDSPGFVAGFQEARRQSQQDLTTRSSATRETRAP